MTAVLIVAGIIVGFMGAFIAYDALRRPGDERDPEQPQHPSSRADYEAVTAAPLSAADEAAAADLVAFVEEISSGEFPNLAFDIDPLGAPIPDGYVVEDEAFFNEVTANWLSAFTWSRPAGTLMELAAVQVEEPPAFELESFTTGWTRADVERMVAEAKAGARS